MENSKPVKVIAGTYKGKLGFANLEKTRNGKTYVAFQGVNLSGAYIDISFLKPSEPKITYVSCDGTSRVEICSAYNGGAYVGNFPFDEKFNSEVEQWVKKLANSGDMLKIWHNGCTDKIAYRIFEPSSFSFEKAVEIIDPIEYRKTLTQSEYDDLKNFRL